MQILMWLAGTIGVGQFLAAALVMGVRLGDGTVTIIPGGLQKSGEWFNCREPDWTFASDIKEMELQLVEPPGSRTSCLQVHDKILYVGSGYMNSTSEMG